MCQQPGQRLPPGGQQPGQHPQPPPGRILAARPTLPSALSGQVGGQGGGQVREVTGHIQRVVDQAQVEHPERAGFAGVAGTCRGGDLFGPQGRGGLDLLLQVGDLGPHPFLIGRGLHRRVRDHLGAIPSNQRQVDQTLTLSHLQGFRQQAPQRVPMSGDELAQRTDARDSVLKNDAGPQIIAAGRLDIPQGNAPLPVTVQEQRHDRLGVIRRVPHPVGPVGRQKGGEVELVELAQHFPDQMVFRQDIPYIQRQQRRLLTPRITYQTPRHTTNLHVPPVSPQANLTTQPIELANRLWWGSYAAAAGSVLVWRVGMPLARSARHGLRVDRVEVEGPGVVSVYLWGTHLDRLSASAGQFFTWRFLDGRGWTRGHPYSLSAAPTSDQLRITVNDLGAGSRRLARLRPGARVLIEGPYGRLHAGVRTGGPVTLIASGIGITPIRALLEEFATSHPDVTLIYRASTEADLVFRREIDEIAAHTGARVHYLLGPRLRG